MNPYEILDISDEATQEEVRAAYLKLSKKHHPDVNGGDESEFIKIKNAYDVLNDPAQKKIFDDFGLMPGTPEFQIMSDAVVNISRVWDQVIIAIKLDDLPKVNPILMVRETIVGSRNEGMRQVAEIKAALHRLETAKKIMKKQLKKKKKLMPNIFEKFLEDKINQVNQTLAAMQGSVSVYLKAEEILDGYEFTVEKDVVPDPNMIVYQPKRLGGLGSIFGLGAGGSDETLDES